MIDEFLSNNELSFTYEYYSIQYKVDELVIDLKENGMDITNPVLNQLFTYYKENNRIIKTMNNQGEKNIDNDIKTFFNNFYHYKLYHRYSFYRYLCDNYNENYSESHVYKLMKENAPSESNLTEIY